MLISFDIYNVEKELFKIEQIYKLRFDGCQHKMSKCVSLGTIFYADEGIVSF